MARELKATGQRGGNRHPLSVSRFILDHLARVKEDYIAAMHRAYKAELDRIALEKGRRHRYHKSVHHSFYVEVETLRRQGLIEFSGREEKSDNSMFAMRRYYRLK